MTPTAEVLLAPRSRTPKVKPARAPRATERAYRIPTAWGDWYVAFSDLGLRELALPGTGRGKGATGLEPLAGQEGELGARVLNALKKRLEGKRVDLPWEAFDLSGRPPFYTKIWRAMHAIPHGAVKSYGDLAREAGSPRAVRAAGSACGGNPIVLFLPCHRVVSSTGPGGFGCGLEWKKKLLALEGYALEA